MKVILFGATGMVGQGALRQCLIDPRVEAVLAIGRTDAGVIDPKLRSMVRADLFDLSDVESELDGYDACLFCVGVSSVGMSEPEYRRITLDLTVSVAKTLARVRPGMRFLYISGAGTDSTEHGRSMWARVKGQTENELLRMPLDAYALRPGFIQPMHGVRSKTRLYRAAYAITSPLYPVLRRAFPRAVTSNETLGRAMVTIAAQGAEKHVLETADINNY
jgi:uncharacterized protein YbjT (DUF2867 family)